MSHKKEFKCTQCGACCDNIGLFYDGLPTNNNGSCIYLVSLVSQKLCSIYEVRPSICRVGHSRSLDPFQDLSDHDYDQLLIKSCETLQNLTRRKEMVDPITLSIMAGVKILGSHALKKIHNNREQQKLANEEAQRRRKESLRQEAYHLNCTVDELVRAKELNCSLADLPKVEAELKRQEEELRRQEEEFKKRQELSRQWEQRLAAQRELEKQSLAAQQELEKQRWINEQLKK